MSGILRCLYNNDDLNQRVLIDSRGFRWNIRLFNATEADLTNNLEFFTRNIFYRKYEAHDLQHQWNKIIYTIQTFVRLNSYAALNLFARLEGLFLKD